MITYAFYKMNNA